MNVSPGSHRYDSRTLRSAVFTAVALLLLLALCQPAAAARDVRVAIHEIKPSLYTDDEGKPAGIFVDLITDIAAQEGWNIIFVHGTFQENLDRLAAGDIDLVMALTRTPEREKVYDFNREPAVSSWTQVYAAQGAGIDTIIDLDKKRVAVLKGDVNAIALKDTAAKFNIEPTYLEVDNLSEAFSRTAAGDADAAIASRVAGQEYEQRYGLFATSVMFYPNPLGFAVPEGKNQDLLQAIDRYLARGKSDPSSYYSQTMQKWFGEKAGWVIPPYVLWGLAFMFCLVFLFVIMSLVLRQEVQRKTAELFLQNRKLQSEVASRKRAEDELVRKNEELQAAYEELTSIEEELRSNFNELEKSEQALRQARKKLNVLNTLTFQDIRSGIFSLSGFIELAKGAGPGEAAGKHLEKGAATLQSVRNSLDFAKDYQDLGISEPRWQNVNYVFLYAISHLDCSGISRSVDLGDLEIYADPLLEKVFFNLVDYTIRHRAGATGIALTYQKTEGRITVILTDNGPGIPAADKERIFGRGNASGGGSGLFLAREILSITGISVSETGTEGTGARFEILVPEGAYRFPVKDPA